MKKTILKTPAVYAHALIISFLFIWIISSCSKSDAGESAVNVSREGKGPGTFSSLNSGEATEHNLTVDEAKNFVRAYYENETAGKTAEEIRNVVTSVYFPLSALEKYLAGMKNFNRNTSGLRVYFAKYNKSHYNSIELKDRTLKLDHRNLNTVIFVATEKDAEGYPMDVIGTGAFQPFNAGVACPPLPPSSCKGIYCPLVESIP